MKISKIILLASVMLLAACNPHNKSTSKETLVSSNSVSETTTSQVESTSSVTSSTSKEITSTSEAPTSATSSVITSSEVTTTSSEPVVADKTVTVNLFNNTTCGTMSTDVLNTRLATYINGLAETPFITAITNNKSQIAANIPEKGDSVLIIGSASTIGTLGFQFNVTVKKVSITAQTYHKPYVDYQTGEQVPNVDANSQLQIAGKGTDPLFGLDLKSENNQPVEKTIDLDIDSTTLGLNTINAENGRVLIKSMTFVY